MTRRVHDVGSRHAKLVVIGEAPGAWEEARGEPFVGPAGQKLNEWLVQAGLSRNLTYLTNTYPYRPPGNKLVLIPHDQLAVEVEALHQRLAALSGPVVLVPTGNTALRALTGHGEIHKWRGSILAYQDRAGRTLKVVPTLHPAAVLREPSDERVCLQDWKRIASELTFPEIRLPVREHHINPTLSDCLDFLEVARRADALALDIETPRTLVTSPVMGKTGRPRMVKKKGDRRIVCVGFSHDPAFSITIPTIESYWRGDLPAIWTLIMELCGLATPKVMQNGHFDSYWLASHDIPINAWEWDTMAMHHVLDPCGKHDLATMASLDTRQNFWKDMKDSKDGDDSSCDDAFAAGARYWTYNGIDVAVTRELADTYAQRLSTTGQMAFYRQHAQALFDPLLTLMRQGVRVDQARATAQTQSIKGRCAEILTELALVAGTPLHGKTAISSVKLQTYLYQTLKLPKRISRQTGRVTANEVAIRALMMRYPEKVGKAGALVLEHREQSKLAEFVSPETQDADGRIRCSYKLTTEAGRLSSSGHPMGRGRNLQNIPRVLRDVFIPEPGHVFLNVDLSQAESRVVYLLSQDPRLIELAQRKPWDWDMHTDNASKIFGIPESAITYEQRYLGKKAVHAAQRGMRGTKLSEELLKEGVLKTPQACDAILDAYLAAHPGVVHWFASVRQKVLRDRALTNSWGRRIDFRYERFDDDLYRRAYSFVPQSEIADLLNQWGFLPLHRFLQESTMAARICVQVHDSLLISTPPEEAWTVWRFLKAHLEAPRAYEVGGPVLEMPAEVTLGRTWKGDHAFKQPPTEDEFRAALQQLHDA